MDGILYWFITRKPIGKGLISISFLLAILFCCSLSLAVIEAPARHTGLLPTSAPTNTPTSTPTPQPIGMAVVTGGALNVNAGPGTNYDAVTSVSNGDSLPVYARTEDGKWLQVDRDGQHWVAAALVALEVDIEQVPVTSRVPPSPTAPPTPMPTITSTSTSAPIGIAIATEAFNMYDGPGTNYSPIAGVWKGDTLAVYARTEDSKWLQIGTDAGHWVDTSLVELDIGIGHVPVAASIPPTPVPPTDAPSQ